MQQALPNVETPVKCPNCNSQLVGSGDELVCSKCGLVINVLNKYVASYDQNHTFQDDHYYGSIIAEHGFTSNITRVQRSLFSSNRRKENELKWLIDKICDNFHLGSSIRLYSYKTGLILLNKFRYSSRKNNLAAIATYAVVTASRFYNLNIVSQYKKIQAYLQDIGFKIKTKDLFQVIFNAREIGLVETKYEASKTINEIISIIMKENSRLQKLKPEERIRFINNLRTISIRLFNDLKSRHYYFRSKNPTICLASSIYAASKEAASILNVKNPVTQKELAGYIGYAEYSVRETYEELFGKKIDTAL
jgi:transcription initiation factor TFIIIB Brf1 subunit/transcription initiation factor TFIIB